MIARFQLHLEKKFPEIFTKRVLVAISGGVDSMVLSVLLHRLGIDITLAHCNFQLRGEESDADEDFVTSFAEKWQIPLYKIHFQTEKLGNDLKLNTQLTARKLRYEWFEKLCTEKDIPFIATAHHTDDSIETFLINLSRGCGLNGLLAIPERNGRIIRPLLPFSKEEILTFAEKEGILWQNDSSNDSDKYIRNKIRHHISPKLKEIHPEFIQNFIKTQKFLQQTQHFLTNQVKKQLTKYFIQKENSIYIDSEGLEKDEDRLFLLFEGLKIYGFHTKLTELEQLFYSEVGKIIYSHTHQLIKDRKQWILIPLSSKNEKKRLLINNENEFSQLDGFSLERISYNEIDFSDTSCLYIDAEQLIYPLTLRNYEEGDWFYPFGMQGKKKISKFYKDEGYTLIEKENQLLLVNGDTAIIWILGKRSDRRFSVKETTKHILRIKIQ